MRENSAGEKGQGEKTRGTKNSWGACSPSHHGREAYLQRRVGQNFGVDEEDDAAER